MDRPVDARRRVLRLASRFPRARTPRANDARRQCDCSTPDNRGSRGFESDQVSATPWRQTRPPADPRAPPIARGRIRPDRTRARRRPPTRAPQARRPARARGLQQPAAPAPQRQMSTATVSTAVTSSRWPQATRASGRRATALRSTERCAARLQDVPRQRRGGGAAVEHRVDQTRAATAAEVSWPTRRRWRRIVSPDRETRAPIASPRRAGDSSRPPACCRCDESTRGETGCDRRAHDRQLPPAHREGCRAEKCSKARRRHLSSALVLSRRQRLRPTELEIQEAARLAAPNPSETLVPTALFCTRTRKSERPVTLLSRLT